MSRKADIRVQAVVPRLWARNWPTHSIQFLRFSKVGMHGWPYQARGAAYQWPQGVLSLKASTCTATILDQFNLPSLQRQHGQNSEVHSITQGRVYFVRM